ncbi:MAG: hypothetical protein V3T88_02755 [Nitrosomonadaceae bacterium]
MNKLGIVLLMMFGTVQAGEISVSSGQRTMAQGGDDFTVGEWNFIEMTYKPEGSNFYYGFSHEKAEVSPVSYLGWTYEMPGILGGLEKKISDDVTLFGHLGYHFISNNVITTGRTSEALEYYFNGKFHYLAGRLVFKNAKLNNSNAFSGTVGIKVKSGNVGFLLGYRLMKIREALSVRFEHDNNRIWAVDTVRDYSGVFAGINVNF